MKRIIENPVKVASSQLVQQNAGILDRLHVNLN